MASGGVSRLSSNAQSINVDGQGLNGGILKHPVQWKFDLKLLAQAGIHAGGGKGVTAKFKKVVMDAEGIDLENVLPDG